MHSLTGFLGTVFAIPPKGEAVFPVNIYDTSVRVQLTRQVIILFEDGEVRSESIQYGIVLAQRLEASLVLLMLHSNTQKQGKEQQGAALEPVVAQARKAGLAVQGEQRRGDKTSELLKFLALQTNPATLILGSGQSITPQGSYKTSRHWLSKVVEKVGCPVVSPTMKHAAKKEYKEAKEKE